MIKISIPTGAAIRRNTAKPTKMSSPVPVDPSLLDWAERWYPISWWLLAAAGVITAVGACATVVFFILQWRTVKIRERQADWHIAQLGITAAQANERAGKANERAASLEKDAAQARLEQEKLKQLLAWRTLSEAETASLSAALKNVSVSVSRWVSLQFVRNDSESLYLAQQITRILEDAGWKVTWHACTWVNDPMVGLHIPGENDVTLALRGAFSAAKIDFSSDPVESPNSFTTMGSRPSATDTIR
jgi:hypothetical protein